MKKEIALATNNPGKLREYREILAPLGYLIYCPKDLNISVDPAENGTTYEENAYIKAKALKELVPFPVIADDSGIEIASLDNFPGIHTARYAKECGGYPLTFLDLNKRLGEKDRSACYRCCICLLESNDSKPLFFEGICKGSLLKEAKGDHGFGYDPIFHYDEGNMDFGTASEEAKNKVSHRHEAIIKLATYLSI